MLLFMQKHEEQNLVFGSKKITYMDLHFYIIVFGALKRDNQLLLVPAM